MKRKLIGFAAVAALATGIVLAQAPRHGRQHRLEMLSTVLNLTDAQKEQAKSIFGEAEQASKPVRQQLRDGHQAIAQAVKAGDEAQIDALAKAQGTLMGQMAAIHSKAFSKLYAILTPEQKEKAGQLHDGMKNMFEDRFGGPHHQ
jgi:Spy/CpxP family protein refolding chaperone